MKNMEIGDRIKQIRKTLKLTQAEFAEKIGLKQSVVGMYEKGTRNIVERNISLICEKFNINPDWLRCGSGEMFQNNNKTIISQVAQEYALDDLDVDILESYLSLNLSDRQAIKKLLHQVIEKRISKEHAKHAEIEHAATEAKSQVSPVDEEIEKELEKYRAELIDEKYGKTHILSENTESKLA